MDYFEMTKPKDEEKPKEEDGGKKEEKSEKKEDAPAPDKTAAPEPKAEHKFHSLLQKLEKFKVHMDGEKIKSAEDLVEQLEVALHALEGAGATADAGGADMGAGKGKEPTLEPEQGSMFMSLQKEHEVLKKDVDALKAELLKKDGENLALEKQATEMLFSAVEKDTEGLVAKGSCTKAQRDEWLGRIKKISGEQRFSLLQPDRSVDMAAVCAEIRMARSIPEGTFLPKKAVEVTVDTHPIFSNSYKPNGNGTTQLSLSAEENKEKVMDVKEGDMPTDPEKKAEFEDVWKKIRMSCGIRD